MKVYAREYLVTGSLDLVDDPGGHGYALWHTGLQQYWETAIPLADARIWRDASPVPLDDFQGPIPWAEVECEPK